MWPGVAMWRDMAVRTSPATYAVWLCVAGVPTGRKVAVRSVPVAGSRSGYGSAHAASPGVSAGSASSAITSPAVSVGVAPTDTPAASSAAFLAAAVPEEPETMAPA